MDIFYQINKHLSNNELVKSKELLDSIDTSTLKNVKSYKSLLLKYYVIKNDIEMVDKIVMNNDSLMKRDYLLYCKFSDNIENKINIFTKLIVTDEINNKDIDFIIEYCPDMLYFLNGYYCQTSKKSNFNDYSIFKKYNIEFYKDNIIDFYKTKINIEYINKLLINKDIIIDAGNVSFFNTKNNTPNYNNIIKVIKLVMQRYKNPLIIIHQRHMKKSNKFINILKTTYKDNIYITPYNTYDDYYIVYSMIKNNIPVITNDKFRDHIYDMFKLVSNNKKVINMITNYIKDNIINYNLNSINYKNHHIYNYSRCIHYVNDIVYIPTNDGYFRL